MNGNQATPNVLVAQVPTDWHLAGIGDFNGDWQDDMLWRNDNGTFAHLADERHSGHAQVVVAQVPTDWHIAGTRRLQRRRQGRYPVAQRQRHLRHLADERQSGRAECRSWPKCPPTGTSPAPATSTATARDDLLWRNDNGTFGPGR